MNIYDIARAGNGNPLVERDFQAWREANARGDTALANQILADAIHTVAAVSRGELTTDYASGAHQTLTSEDMLTQVSDAEIRH